jgi:hypothetical protein
MRKRGNAPHSRRFATSDTCKFRRSLRTTGLWRFNPPGIARSGGVDTIGQKSSIFAKIFRAANSPFTTRFGSGYAGLGTIRPHPL